MTAIAGKSDTWEIGLLNLLFKNLAFGGVGDTSGLQPSGTAGNLYFSLHTADPTEEGDQTSSEISYTGYTRQGVARGSGFTVTGSSVSPSATVTFPASTGGTGGTATFFGIGTASSGAGKLLYAGALSPTITVNNGVTPQLSTATAITEG